jgi:hypothetical protein
MSTVFSDVGVAQARAWLRDPALTTASVERERRLEQSVVAELVCAHADGASLRCFLKRSCEAWVPGSGASFAAEAAFLSALGAGECTVWAALRDGGAPTPRPLHAEVRFDGVVTLAMELLDPDAFAEVGAPGGAAGAALGAPRAEAAALLAWLARFHAFWFDKPVPPGVVARGGGWWKRRAAGAEAGARLSGVFAAHARAFPSLAALATPRAAALMAALGRALPALREAADATPHRTLLHGDAKTSNCFFPVAGGGPPVVFDFQWVGGAASGAADLAYFLCGGARCVALGGAGGDAACDALLADYWDEFQRALSGAEGGARGVAPPLTWEALREDFEEELVFYYAAASPALLDPLTPDMMALNRERYGWLLHEQFEGALWWLTRRVLRVLEAWAHAGRI